MHSLLHNRGLWPETDSISVSYLQLYMETIQDLLDPTNDNLSISEDPKSGDITLPGASLIEVRDQPGTTRTSLVITIGPSPRHRGETSSTIMFGQRAMKVENMWKIKEEFDYKSLARKLDVQVESLIAEHERQQKAYKDEVEKISLEAKKQISEAEKSYADSLEKERLKYQRDCMELIKNLKHK
ncbi:kinesin-like protein KIN-UA [Artemisia annua]|uniref:Kinesin-like protein KIN-UA n=1 Tax=Artemisia annua TaxID=35608 RepID=A0A2U1PIL0_ARTAN|nr:kinesin-like protein KIN-UA [Artemisia annua]